MHRLFVQLLRDEAGYVLSAELVLIASIGVLSLVVGLSEVSTAINGELFDIGSAFARLNQPSHAQTPTSYNSGSNSQNSQGDAGNGPADVMGTTAPQGEN